MHTGAGRRWTSSTMTTTDRRRSEWRLTRVFTCAFKAIERSAEAGCYGRRSSRLEEAAAASQGRQWILEVSPLRAGKNWWEESGGDGRALYTDSASACSLHKTGTLTGDDGGLP